MFIHIDEYFLGLDIDLLCSNTDPDIFNWGLNTNYLEIYDPLNSYTVQEYIYPSCDALDAVDRDISLYLDMINTYNMSEKLMVKILSKDPSGGETYYPGEFLKKSVEGYWILEDEEELTYTLLISGSVFTVMGTREVTKFLTKDFGRDVSKG